MDLYVTSSQKLCVVIDECSFSRRALEALTASASCPCTTLLFQCFADFLLWRRGASEEIALLVINLHNYRQLIDEGFVDVLLLHREAWRIHHTSVLFLYSRAAPQLLCYASRAPGCMMVNKNQPVRDIAKCLAGLLQHDNADGQQAAPVSKSREAALFSRLDSLTPKEVRALHITLDGNDLAYWANELGVSVKTLYSQRASALFKLGINRSSDIVRYKGLIERILSAHR
ncbi:hypothetical protein AO703_12080 [[Enterobacter] lignolyticus]|uniref:HTH luxR-type domain-containing protein n=1 Tax=[Enterobacter] lignolyticus TaxID=1334193 RepID=A0A806XDA2_9ENTR|nr:hypothetical protein AO703_12080 [[Enterobacter] lignolyticus]